MTVITETLLTALRQRLGAAMADRLIVDAATGRRACLELLDRRLAISLGMAEAAGTGEPEAIRTLLDQIDRGLLRDERLWLRIPCNGAQWDEDMLVLPENLPETIVGALPGRRLGDLVAGTGQDDLVIAEARNGGRGTMLTLRTRDVVIEDIALPLGTMLAGPMRRAALSTAGQWRHRYADAAWKRPVTASRLAIGILLAVLVPFALVQAVLHPFPALLTGHPLTGWERAVWCFMMVVLLGDLAIGCLINLAVLLRRTRSDLRGRTA